MLDSVIKVSKKCYPQHFWKSAKMKQKRLNKMENLINDKICY